MGWIAWCFAIWAATALAGLAPAAAVDGTLTFPSAFVPALTVYARNLDTSKLHSVSTRESQTAFRIDLPPGRYVFFAEPSEPGAPEIYGAYTQSVLCTARNGTDACADHGLVVYSTGSTAATPAIGDWTIPDNLADEFDRLLGNRSELNTQELGAPHFSEYPVPTLDSAQPAAAVDFSTSGLAAEQQERVQEIAKTGANFAGNLVLAAIPCGANCVDAVILDLHTGKAQLPPAFTRIVQDLPCRSDESILFRRNSRLLSITRKRDARIVTQYFVWKPDTASLNQTAEYQRTVERFCSLPAHEGT